MGCGGSRMDVLEPRYLESWTKDTESTWLGSGDPDIPLSSIQSLASESSSVDTGLTSHKTSTPVPEIFADALPHPAQAYVKVCSSLSEASLDEEAEAKTAPARPSVRQGGKRGRVREKSLTAFEVVQPVAAAAGPIRGDRTPDVPRRYSAEEHRETGSTVR